MFLTRRVSVALVTAGLIFAACGGTSVSTTTTGTNSATDVIEEPDSTPPPTTETSTTAAVASSTSTSTVAPTTTTTTQPPDDVVALSIEGNVVTIVWDGLGSTPFFAPASGGDDPFFHIHTDPEKDGFFLSFELYTTGYGEAWTGETGTFEISCSDIMASTGICPYFDPDGPGPMPVVGDDFGATGSLTIVQLDDAGYEIIVHELVFTDGTTFAEFTMKG